MAAEITDTWTIEALIELAEESETMAAALEEAGPGPDPDRG
jgi:hypothetical protein